MITNHDPCFDVLFFRKLVVAESSSRCVYRCLLSATGAALAAHAAHEVACHLGDGRVVHHGRQIRHASGATSTANLGDYSEYEEEDSFDETDVKWG